MKTNRNRWICALAVAGCVAVLSAAAGAQQMPQGISEKLGHAVGLWQLTNSDGSSGGKVETYLVEGKLEGKVTEVRAGRTPKDLCDKCAGELKNKPILGMVIMRNFHPQGDDWVEGTVVDPENGKEYKGKIWAVGADELHMRGFVGIQLLGRTEVWKRIR